MHCQLIEVRNRAQSIIPIKLNLSERFICFYYFLYSYILFVAVSITYIIDGSKFFSHLFFWGKIWEWHISDRIVFAIIVGSNLLDKEWKSKEKNESNEDGE